MQYQVAGCKTVPKQGFKITLKRRDIYKTPYVQSLLFSFANYFRVSCKQKLIRISNTYLNSRARAQPQTRSSSCGNISIYVPKNALNQITLLLFSRLYNVFTSSCANLTFILHYTHIINHQLMKSITLNLPTPECYLQGVYEHKESQVQQSTSGIFALEF